MFSGIVEATAQAISSKSLENTVQIHVLRPEIFNDISTGDSISTNGVCLTVEKITPEFIQFTLGKETLDVTGWTDTFLKNKSLNMERSLKLGDRIHGHLVSGHVDTMAKVLFLEKGESWVIGFEVQNLDRKYVWNKGSITLNGVSLTVNKVTAESVEVCLIPETLLRTNLKELHVGDSVTVEYDYWAKAFVNFQEQREVVP